MLAWIMNMGFAASGSGAEEPAATPKHRGFTINVARLLRSSR